MTKKERIKELEAVNMKLRVDNLRMRLEIDVLCDSTTSRAAGIILAKYRRKRDKLYESFIALNN
jgi:hypothetical protein